MTPHRILRRPVLVYAVAAQAAMGAFLVTAIVWSVLHWSLTQPGPTWLRVLAGVALALNAVRWLPPVERRETAAWAAVRGGVVTFDKRTMRVLGDVDVLDAIAKGLGKPVLQVTFDPEPPPDAKAGATAEALRGLDGASIANRWWEELRQAAPYLFFPPDQPGEPYIPHGGLIFGGGFIVCDSEEECHRLFDLTVGDDGPTHLNPYDGPARVHAVTSTGRENT